MMAMKILPGKQSAVASLNAECEFQVADHSVSSADEVDDLNPAHDACHHPQAVRPINR
jgi:hypothetical protein